MLTPESFNLVQYVGVEAAGTLATLVGAQLTQAITHWLKVRLGYSGEQTARLSWAVGVVMTNLISLSLGVYGDLNAKSIITVVVSTLIAVMTAQGDHERKRDVETSAMTNALERAEPVKTKDVSKDTAADTLMPAVPDVPATPSDPNS